MRRAWKLLAVAVLAAAGCGGEDEARAPATPANVSAVPGDAMVSVRWDAVAGAEGYVVYWATAIGVSRASGTPIDAQGTSVTHSGLTNGVAYFYVVTARNGAGESPESPEVSAIPLPSHYPLTISTDGTGGGAVASSPPAIDCGDVCGASLARGGSVTLTATPDATSTFAGWSGDCSGAGPCTLTMDGARTVGATFTRNTHALSVAREGTGGGTVASTPAGIDCGPSCAAVYDEGTAVTLTATPDATSTFAGWSGDCSGTGDCVLSMDAARSVTATFARIRYALTVTNGGGGTVTSTPAGIDCGSTCTASFDAGTQVVLTASAASGAAFLGWSGACTGAGSCTVSMDGAKSVAAAFAFPLAVSRAGAGGGTVASAPAGISCGSTCTALYSAGTTVVLTASPDTLSSFAGWTGDCAGAATCALTMSGPRSVGATFTRNRYALTVNNGGGGTVSASPAGIDCGSTCTASYDAGTQVTLTASADPGGVFLGWVGACTGAGSCTVLMDGAKSVGATFAFPLAVSRAGAGGGTVASTPAGISCGSTCTALYSAGTTVVLTASPDALSSFAGWSAACAGTGDCVLSMDAAKSVTATFTRNRYALTVTNGGGGTVTSTPAGIDCGSTCTASFDAGTQVVLTASAAPGAVFLGWSGACTGAGPCTVSMDGAKSVTATFAFPLDVSRAGAGVGTVASVPAGISCGSTCTGMYAAGTVVQLSATPGATSVFLGWSGSGCSGTGSCAVVMTGVRTVTATFGPSP